MGFFLNCSMLQISAASKSVYAFLKETHTPDAISSIAYDTYNSSAHLLKVNSHGHFDKEIAQQLKILAQKSVGVNGSALSIQATLSIQQIELLDSQLERVKSEMTDIMKFHYSVIMTIPGISYINRGIILVNIGYIHRFPNRNKQPAYVGLNSSVYQSGNFTRIRRRRCLKVDPKPFDIHLLMYLTMLLKTTPSSRLPMTRL